MPRQLNSTDEMVIEAAGTPLTKRKYIKFQGDGITSVTDDSGNGRTVVAVGSGGGGVAGGYKGYRRYEGSPTVTSVSGSYVNAGSLIESGGDQSWFDAVYSSPSTSLFYFAEHGLYRYTLVVAFTASASLVSGDQIGLRSEVFPGTQMYPRSYEVTQGVRIAQSHPTDASTVWRGTISITDYFGPGDTPGESGIINTQWIKYSSMPGSLSVSTETWISRIL